MRRLALVWVFLAASAPALAQGGPTERATVVARVADVAAAPRCGDTHVAVLVRMEVVSVAAGSVGPGPLYTYWDCGQVGTPGVGMYSAEVGDVYRLELRRHAPASFGDSMAEPPSGAAAYYAVRGRPAR